MPSVGKILRGVPQGIIQLAVGTASLAVGSWATGQLSGYLSFTIGTTTIDIGMIPGVVLAFGGVLLFVSGLSKMLRVRF